MKTINTLLCLAVCCIFLTFSTTASAAVIITTGTITPLHYCPGDSVLVPFTVSASMTNGNIFTAQLSNDTGQFATPVAIGTLASTNSGTVHCMIPGGTFPSNRYRIRVIGSNPNVTGSTSVDSFIVYNDNFTVSIAAFTTATFCSGDSCVIWNVTGGIFTSYQWYRNNIAITGATSDHYAATSTGLYTLQLSTPCATFTSASGVVVTVNQSPNMSVLGDTIICIGDHSVLQAYGSYSYSWSPANSLNQSNTSQVLATPSVTTTYTVTGTNINGCTGTTTYTVHVNQLPHVHAYTAADTICLGASVLLTGTGCDLYFWSPANSLNISTGDSVIATPSTTTMYQVIGKNNSCTPISVDSVLVTVVPGTILTITGTPDSICNGETSTLTVTGANSYVWSPGISLNDSTLSAVNASPSITTAYVVNGDFNGCHALDTFVVNIKPAPNIIISGADTICVGNSTTLTASGALNYVWSPFIGLVDTVNAAEIANPTSTTTYTVHGLGTNGCMGTATFTLDVDACAGIHEALNNGSAITIFPNPASTVVTINFMHPAELIITDVVGRKVYQELRTNSTQATIDIAKWNKGIYFIQMMNTEESVVKKLVID